MDSCTQIKNTLLRSFSYFLITFSSFIFSSNTWAVSAGCTAVNGGSFDRTVAGITLLLNDTFDAGEVLRFTFVSGGTGGATFNISDDTAGVPITAASVPASPVDYTIPLSGARNFNYQINGLVPAGSINNITVTCPSGNTGANANDNGQNNALASARQQSDDILDIINRNINGFTGNEVTTSSYFEEATSVVNKHSLAATSYLRDIQKNNFNNNYSADLTEDLETENFAVVMNAAAQYSSGEINKALRTLNLEQYFVFTEIQGVLTFDDRGPTERQGETIAGSAGFGYKYNDQITFGLAGSYSISDSPLAALTGETETDGFLLNPFISYRSESGLLWTANGGFGLYDNSIDTGTATGKFDSRIINFAGSVQKNIAMNAFILNPRASFTYEYVKANGFTDSAGTVAADESETTGAIHLNLGIIHNGFDLNSKYRLLPFLDAEMEWSFKRADSFLLANGTNFSSTAVVGEIAGGVRLVDDANFELILEGGTRQIGESDFDVYHFGAQLSYAY